MVKRKGTYRLKEKQEKLSPGKLSESNHLLHAGTVKPPLLSKDGSYATEQESLVVRIRPDSMISLGNFNDDDDFMGNFDEDGSFIGDYLEKDEEQARAVQNKLLVFLQMYRENGVLHA
eukprot:GFUD01071905.1.p1 GENE.GFUD01071905.1~~GFUD01071905.1.p1  ORF type:complete len:118 (-),score=28.05 GFUD01071905.1:113-466(-)